MFEGYAIVPPISPWDEKHREEIEMDTAIRTIEYNPGAAWRIHCERGKGTLEHGELSSRIQHWYDRGYRLRKVRVEFVDWKPPV